MGQCNNNSNVKCLKCGEIVPKDQNLDLKAALQSHDCTFERTFFQDLTNLENSTIKSAERVSKTEVNSEKKINKKVTLTFI